MLLKQGDKWPEVSEVQKLLSLIGYDLIIDGDFGAKTTRSVKSFQKKYSLTVDGVVGNNTYQTLKSAQKRSSKENPVSSEKNYGSLEVIKDHLDSSQYIKQDFEKKQIYLHFTAGSANAKNVIHGWNSNEARIATSFVIDGRDGSIYECFHPSYWSYHLGVKGTRGKLDKHSIGIEICNWGPLKEKDGKYYTWPADYSKYTVEEDEVVKLDTPHRGFNYFHKITDAQMDSVEKLLEYLVKEYKIPVDQDFNDDWFEYKEDVIKQQTPGIWTHVNVRKDKSDLCPDQRVLDMLNRIKSKFA